jgi:hypothetical protein
MGSSLQARSLQRGWLEQIVIEGDDTCVNEGAATPLALIGRAFLHLVP